ncbi:MFS transporter [Paractinoplanes toevensis]|uniref:MFS transporter n=1 Tax=Paractinoplanes toevensis TaxID=571911 RepID=A0A919TF42_9ACTN|nr:MFS transporter [Actinoplanes toevensis]GIM94288.1 MFS transporter [Actinoplanes toevensis]
MGFVLARYVGTAVCARLADEGARVAVLLLAIERTGRPGTGGLLVAALMVPHVLAAPIVGALADVVRRRRLFYLAIFVAYAALLAGVTPLVGRNAPAAAAMLLVAGCGAPLLIGGLTSLLGELVRDTAAPDAGAARRLQRAFGLDVSSYSMAGIGGPALAAALAVVIGAAWALVALAGLVVLGGLLLATLPLRTRATAARMADPLAGLRLMVRDRELGAVTLGSVLKETGIGALPVVAALLAVRAGDTAYTGVVLSVAAAGGLAGSLLTTVFPIRRRSPLVVVVLGAAGTGLTFLLLAVVPHGWPALVLFAVAGALGAPLVVAVFAVRDRAAPPELRTQVFTLGAGLKVTGAALGAAVAGLAAPAGAVVLLLGIAGCQLLAVLATLLVGRVTLARREPESIVS